MIDLKEACEIIISLTKRQNAQVFFTKCKDFGDSWVIDWSWKDNPTQGKVGLPMFRVYKESGVCTYFPAMGIPDKEELRAFENAESVPLPKEYIAQS